MRSLYLLAFVAGVALAFGVPGVPDVDVPDFEIPGMELLDEVQLKLDGILAQSEALRDMIPDLAVLDELSLKLEELRDTNPEFEALQVRLDVLRDDLSGVKAEMDAITDNLDSEIGTVKATMDEFTEGLPI